MQDEPAFSLSPASRVLTPEAPGLGPLMVCLRERASFRARQTEGAPIMRCEGAPQRLHCESSGTSGAPKVVRRSPASWIASFDLHHARFGQGEADVYATLGALGHSLTLFATLEALHLGADLAALAGTAPKRQAACMSDFGVTTLYATPAQLRLLLRGAQAGGVAFPALRRIFCGGGKLDEALRRALSEACPNAALREFFGAAETSFITMGDADTPAGSVGRVYPGVTLEVRTGLERACPGETGEIWVQSPYLFEGYEGGGSDDTRWQEGFLGIGEMGYLDAQGHLFLRGRKGRMVTVADRNVFPEEIEAVVMRHPAVTLCAALPVPDARRGHSIACVVEAREAQGLEAGLRRLCREALGAGSVPRRFVFTRALRLLPGGKPDLVALRQELEASA